MTKAKQTSGKVFHGWWVVLVAGVGLSLSYGPIIVTTFGVFLKPLSQEFGWSRAEVSLAFSLSILAMTVEPGQEECAAQPVETRGDRDRQKTSQFG